MTNTPTYEVTIRRVDGEPMIDAAGMALLFGVPTEKWAELTGGGTAAIPPDWVKAGRRRAREAMAHTGSDAMLDSLAYWAKRDHGAALVLTEVDQ